MKKIAFIFITLLALSAYAQTETNTCSGLPVAVPEKRAVCEVSDLVHYFEIRMPDALKKGTYSAVYKLTVDCKGAVEEASYQRGTFGPAEQESYTNQLMALSWKPAKQKNKNVTSFVFVTLEIVNGKFTVAVQ